ncbi:MAG: vitamin B12 dependent-methionine synthase activation domain-containing protein [Eubacteriales bacterium]|nr:vitamin B12 dependent-methionine synthase activation domain-containing protein [Eubacteriales bacterium]
MHDTDMNIIITLDDTILGEKDRSGLIAKAGEDNLDEITDMFNQAQSAARPLALYSVLPVEKTDGNSVTINGVTIKSQLMRNNFDGVNRVFPYIATCGAALEEWSASFTDDPLAEYFADEIKKIYLSKMISKHFEHIKNTYHIKGHFSAMNPGSIKQWPLSGQRELFAIFGREYIYEKIGVRLTDSMLMLPSKTVSGIGFESESEYHNCTHCPLVNCPNRRAESEVSV